MTFFTLCLFGKWKQNLVPVSPTKFFHDYSQDLCQSRCVTGLLKSMTLFLIFGQHPKISYTGIFGTTFWHPYAGICFLQRTVIFPQIHTIPLSPPPLPQMYMHNELLASVVCSKRIDFRNHWKIYDSVLFVWASTCNLGTGTLPYCAQDMVLFKCMIILHLWAMLAWTG